MALYAAYGSNMDSAQMAERCPHSPQHGTGWLEGWRLTFGGEELGWEGALATVVEDRAERVFVVLYDVTTRRRGRARRRRPDAGDGASAGTIGEVYRQGKAGKLPWAAKGLATAGAALLARRGRTSRTAAVVGGAMICAGELCLRWAVFKAGSQSARDPRYVVESQRSRIERDGTKATTKPG